MNSRLLGDICDFAYGDSLPEERRRGGIVPVYGSNGVVGRHNSAITSGPTIVIGRKGSIGEIRWSDKPCFPIDTTYYIETTKLPCELRWLYYALLQLDLTRFNKSAAVPGLNREDAYEKRIQFPTVAEQRYIAAQLDQADRLRRARRYTLELSGNFLPATFRKFFGDSLRELPRWKPVPISELCESITDCVNKTAPLSETLTPFKMIRTTNVRNGEVDLTAVRYVTEETFKTWTRRSVPQHGDIILTREAPLGEVGILKNPHNIFLGQRLVQYRVNPAKATPEYLLHALLSTDLQHQLKRLGAGSTVEHIAVPDCEALMVMKPPHDLQQHFTTLVTQHERLLATQRESLRQAEHLFQTLLHRAFSPD